MEKITLEIFNSEDLYDNKGDMSRLSSAPAYDSALSSIFPHYIKVSQELGQELSGVLARGYETIGFKNKKVFLPTSFASVLNDRGYSEGKPRIIWLSRSSVSVLDQHSDLYDIVRTEPADNMGQHTDRY
jgi:hypothetical protein